MGRIFAEMGLLYAWATPDYLLKKMSLDQILLYYKNGWKAEKQRANILIYKLSYLLAGKPEPQENEKDYGTDYQAPDRKALVKAFPDLNKGVVKR